VADSFFMAEQLNQTRNIQISDLTTQV